ncbi:MAG: COG1615 family transporter, partial [Candidatus Lokiarchaeota archaeon]|nr:COG1615 family transporter [Candidatus Lokiarchaeota archaeon]
DRVQAMLLPFMYMDADPYLVFNPVEHRVHYCVPLDISIPAFTYFKTDYKRFIGWIILDVYSGEMVFYRSPTINTVNEINSLLSFAQVYVDTAMYPWRNSTDVPAWLQPQLRYPENFYESQLETDYTYHVTDWRVWHDKNDFFDRPRDGDLYYVMMDLGEGRLEFVGVELVVPTSGTTTLAGMYVLRNKWDRFGETLFYRTPQGKTLIGPKTAEQTFITNPGISSALTLVQGRDTGNILLYEFAGSLYYVIPIYTTTGGLQDLRYVGLVNAFKETEVVWSETAKGAFDQIAALHSPPTPPVSLSVNTTGPASVTSPSLANVSIAVQNTVTNYSVPAQNVSISMYVYSQASSMLLYGVSNVPVTFNDPAFPSLGQGVKYALANWSLAPTQLEGLTVQLNLSLGNFSARTVPYRVVATLPNGTSFSSPMRSITFTSPSHAATNVTGAGVTLGFSLPTAVVEPNNASLMLNVKNNDMNLGNPALDVKVNLTLFSVNGTVKVPGMPVIASSSFTSDAMHAGVPGTTYTVIDRDLYPQGVHGITVLVDLDITGNIRVELVYRLDLIVNDVLVATTMLRVITWTA